MTRRQFHTTRRAAFLLFALLFLPASPIPGEEGAGVTLSGESRTTATRLTEARKRLDEQKWTEAVEALQSIRSSAGNDLVPIGAMHSVQARRLCQIHLASLPPEARKAYRQRYETQARKRFEQAQSGRDTELLRRVVDEAFLTRAAEKAIDLLGDLAFERGRFDEAEEWWRLLAPLPDARRDKANRGMQLAYPDPSLDPARLQAKQLLAHLFARSGADGKADLEAFTGRYGEASGTLAGRKGRYGEVLRALAERQKKEGIPDADWTTFGGAPSRGRVIPADDDILDRLSALCRSDPTWRFNLQNHSRREESSFDPAVNAGQARTLAFHPVIVGEQVLLADARYVTAYNLRTGSGSVWYDAAPVNGGLQANLKLPAPADLRYTLTAADEGVYVRLGEQNIGLDAANARRDKETFLAYLSWRPDADGERARWIVRSATRDNSLWEGAPLAVGGQSWIASIRYQNGRGITAIDCFPADDTSLPQPRWRRDVCETRDLKPGEPRYRHHLLTLAGTQIVYCSHSGVIVAIDALTGRTNWGVRYPRRSIEKGGVLPPEGPTWKDLVPVLFAAGRLYAAPADSDRLLCLDPVTGCTLWEREAMKVIHLLGVGRGRLIFTTEDGLRAVSAADGRDLWSIPDQGGGLAPAGRGLLIGDLVLWPTVRKREDTTSVAVVYAIRQEDGRLADDPALLHRLPAGNLAYANGCLVVADRQTLSVFVPPRLLLRQREAEARDQPDSAAALLALARAEADAGMTERALHTCRRVETKAGILSDSRRYKLQERERQTRQGTLLDTARRHARAKRWEETSAALRQALDVPVGAPGRLHALRRAARIWEDAGQTDAAVAVWQTIRADKTLRPMQITDERGWPASANSAAQAAIARLRGERATAPQPRSVDRSMPASVPPALPLVRSWHVALVADEWVLNGSPNEKDELITDRPGGQLICRDSTTGALLWQRLLPFAPRWAAAHGDTILAAGEQDIARLRRGESELLWHCPAPLRRRHSLGDAQSPEPLTAFQLAAGRLFFLQGQHTLFALNADTGEILWQKSASDAGFGLPYPLGHFSPYYRAGPETVLVQTPGRSWLLDAATGRPIHQDSAGHDLWTQPPLELDEHTLCVVADRQRVALLDARTGRRSWTYTLPGGTTRSGERPQILGRNDLLLLVMPANIGYFLQRLDRASGKPLWPRPRLLTMRSLDVSSWTFDREAVYFAEDCVLKACSLADGRILWEQPLNGSGWRVRRGDDYLVVYPSSSAAEATFRFRSAFGEVQWNWGPALVPEAVFSVECRETKTGRLAQRLNFRLESPSRTVVRRRRTEEGRGRSLVLQSSALLASENGPVIRLDSSGTFVAVGGEVWGLSAAGR